MFILASSLTCGIIRRVDATHSIVSLWLSLVTPPLAGAGGVVSKAPIPFRRGDDMILLTTTIMTCRLASVLRQQVRATSPLIRLREQVESASMLRASYSFATHCGVLQRANHHAPSSRHRLLRTTGRKNPVLAG